MLVGINTYAGRKEAPSPLRGTKNDVDRAERVLLDRFGFEPESVVKLVDADATHEKIVRGIYDHLIKKAGPKTKVVFWFSGHGSHVPDGSAADVDESNAATNLQRFSPGPRKASTLEGARRMSWLRCH